MYRRNTQKLNKRQEFIKVHVFYKREKDNENSRNYNFFLFDPGYLFYSSFFLILNYTISLLLQFCITVKPQYVSLFGGLSFFVVICGLTFFEFSILIDRLNFEFLFDYKFSFIIDSSSLIHEIIHGLIYEKFQGIKKWEVWVIDGNFWCFGYVPENVRFPNFILKSMICRLIHLIHDLIYPFILCDVYYFFDYIKEFFTIEKNYIKELKTQIKARKT